MPISKHYLDTNTEPVHFSVDALAAALESGCPEAIFAYLHGSATDGTVRPHSDVDLAFYLPGKPDLAFHEKVFEIGQPILGDTRVDIGFLKHAEPVYRFEVLKGTLLFCRDQEVWLRFYSVTCREYEHQMWDYERQRRYRLEARRGR